MIYYQAPGLTLHLGDALDVLRELSAESVQCCVTSPPYWALRDYGVDGQYGMEHSPEQFVACMVAVFREVRRVLAKDGTLWLNVGDTYAGGRRGGNPGLSDHVLQRTNLGSMRCGPAVPERLKSKDLIGIPWRLAFALQADGWYLRSDIIWHKPNPMPESVQDRPTKSHEYLFLLSKSASYYYDADAIREPSSWDVMQSKTPDGWDTGAGGHGSFHRQGREKGRSWRGSTFQHGKTARHQQGRSSDKERGMPDGRNKRTVWTIAAQPFPEAHFATFPEKLVEPCISAGCREGGVVLDPFIGSGTTGVVARRLGRSCVGIDINREYLDMAIRRNAQSVLWSEVASG